MSRAAARSLGRLRSKADFQKAFKEGRRIDGAFFLFIAAQNQCAQLRLGLAVSRRVGSAVVRNRAKRLLREALRQRLRNTALPAPTIDLVLVAKPDIGAATLRGLADELERRLARFLRAGTRPRFAAAPRH